MGFVNFFSRVCNAGSVRSKELVLLLAVSMLSNVAGAQTEFRSAPRTGLSAGYGNQLFLGKPYRYQVFLFNLTHLRPLWQNEKMAVELLLMAQVNPTRFKKEDWHNDFTTGLEYGFNAGALVRKPAFRKRHSVYALISSGPHHVNDAPVRQRDGFLFCNYFAAGLMLNPQQQLPVDLRLGARHISNLGMKIPNGGINNLFVAVTVYPFWSRKTGT